MEIAVTIQLSKCFLVYSTATCRVLTRCWAHSSELSVPKSLPPQHHSRARLEPALQEWARVGSAAGQQGRSSDSCRLEPPQSFHRFPEDTCVCGLRGTATLGMLIERMRFSPSAGIDSCLSQAVGERQPNQLFKPLTFRIVWIKWKALFPVTSRVYSGCPRTHLN